MTVDARLDEIFPPGCRKALEDECPKEWDRMRSGLLEGYLLVVTHRAPLDFQIKLIPREESEL